MKRFPISPIPPPRPCCSCSYLGSKAPPTQQLPLRAHAKRSRLKKADCAREHGPVCVIIHCNEIPFAMFAQARGSWETTRARECVRREGKSERKSGKRIPSVLLFVCYQFGETKGSGVFMRSFAKLVLPTHPPTVSPRVSRGRRGGLYLGGCTLHVQFEAHLRRFGQEHCVLLPLFCTGVSRTKYVIIVDCASTSALIRTCCPISTACLA